MSKHDTRGWVCPLCNTAYAPHVNKCECAKVPTQRYVYPVYPYPYQTARPWRWWWDDAIWTNDIRITTSTTSTGSSNTLQIGTTEEAK